MPLPHGRKESVDGFAKIPKRAGWTLTVNERNEPAVPASYVGPIVRTHSLGERSGLSNQALAEHPEKLFGETQ